MNGHAIRLLRAQVLGDVLTPGDPWYEEARHIWNARMKRYPAAIVRCIDPGDVAMTLEIASRCGLPVTVRSGGHSFAGLGSCEGGLVVDLSALQTIEIDAADRLGYVGSGVRWGPFYEAAFRQGLSVVGGTVSDVGVAGLTLGGGTGWLSRKYGLALDNLVAVDLVTTKGEIMEASETENPDLFWGVRGGAGNFCVVTGFQFRLHPVPREMLAGQVMYPFREARKVLQVYRDVMAQAPDDLVCYPTIFHIPPIPAFPEKTHGEVVISLVLCHIGDLDQAKQAVQPLREIAAPILDAVGPRSYLDVQRSFDAAVPDGHRWYSRGHYLDRLSDAAITTIIGQTETLPGPMTFVYLGPEDGKVGQVEPAATAFPHRTARFSLHILAGWSDPEEDVAIKSWVRDFSHSMERYSTGGVYVNLLAEDEPGRVRAAYGDNYNRLVELKRKWDPKNLLRGNHNISPD